MAKTVFTLALLTLLVSACGLVYNVRTEHDPFTRQETNVLSLPSSFLDPSLWVKRVVEADGRSNYFFGVHFYTPGGKEDVLLQQRYIVGDQVQLLVDGRIIITLSRFGTTSTWSDTGALTGVRSEANFLISPSDLEQTSRAQNVLIRVKGLPRDWQMNSTQLSYLKRFVAEYGAGR